MKHAATGKRVLGILSLAGMLGIVSACAGSESAGGKGTDGEVVLGYTNSLTGDLASYGNAFKEGADLAAEEIGEGEGVRIRLEVRDDRGDPKECVTIAQGYGADVNIKAVLGWSSSSCLLAAMPIYEQSQLPVLSSGTTSPELSGIPFFHRNTLTDAAQGELLAAYAADEVGAQRVAILSSNDDYGMGLADSFEGAATDLGLDVVERKSYPPGTRDFRATVTNLTGKDLDLIMLAGYVNEGARVVQQAREVGLTTQFLGGQGMYTQDFIDLAGPDNAEGFLVATEFSPESDAAKDFVSSFEEAHSRAPGQFEALAYDAVMLIHGVIDELGADASREEINEALAGACSDGILGKVCINEDGEVERDITVETVQGGAFVPTS